MPLERLPFVNVDRLNEDDEIQIDYDANGNPVRIRKVRHSPMWVIWLIGIIFLGIVLLRSGF